MNQKTYLKKKAYYCLAKGKIFKVIFHRMVFDCNKTKVKIVFTGVQEQKMETYTEQRADSWRLGVHRALSG